MRVASEWLAAAVTRRQFLGGAAALSTALGFARLSRVARALQIAPPAGFLSPAELRVLEATTARLVPSDETPGALEAGVADYVQALLSVFPGADANGDGRVTAADLSAVVAALGTSGPADVNGDGVVDGDDLHLVERSLFGTTLAGPAAFGDRPLFGRGPFSGRAPFPDPATGTPGEDVPENRFTEPVPLPRVQRLAWTVRLLGASAVPEVRDNPLATAAADVNLRARYRAGLAALQALSIAEHGAEFDTLDPDQQDAVLALFRNRERAFYTLVVHHTIEGMLCAPEYGGNRDLIGWQLTRFDGDSQPLGYTIFDETAGVYRERPDKPNSTLDPDDDCAGFSDEMAEFLRFVLVRLAGAEEFPAAPCFRG